METCPLCGDPVTSGDYQLAVDEQAPAVVTGTPGTFWPHLRDRHPAEFAAAVTRRERMNRVLGGMMGAMPRNVDGTLLTPGRRVGDLP